MPRGRYPERGGGGGAGGVLYGFQLRTAVGRSEPRRSDEAIERHRAFLPCVQYCRARSQSAEYNEQSSCRGANRHRVKVDMRVAAGPWQCRAAQALGEDPCFVVLKSHPE